MKTSRRKEHGNAIFFILIGVALFGALTAAVNFSGRGGNTDALTEEKARIYASEVMDSAERVSSAISTLRLRGCALAQLSFEQTRVAGYENGAAPTNERCHVFSTQGGGLAWIDFSGDIFNEAWSAETDYGQPIFTIKNEIPELGTDADGANSYEMLMLVEGLQSSVCDIINERAVGNITLNNANEVETKYEGTLNTTGTYTFPAAFNAQRQGCYSDNSGSDSGTLTYYYVLMIR